VAKLLNSLFFGGFRLKDVEMIITMWQGDEWESLSLEFFLYGRADFKIPVSKQRRDLLFKLLKSQKWILVKKDRRTVTLRTKMRDELVEAIETLLSTSIRFPKGFYEEHKRASAKKLIKALKRLKIATRISQVR